MCFYLIFYIKVLSPRLGSHCAFRHRAGGITRHAICQLCLVTVKIILKGVLQFGLMVFDMVFQWRNDKIGSKSFQQPEARHRQCRNAQRTKCKAAWACHGRGAYRLPSMLYRCRAVWYYILFVTRGGLHTNSIRTCMRHARCCRH